MAPQRLFHELRLQLFDHPAPPATAAAAFDFLGRSAWHGAGAQKVPRFAAFLPSRGDVRQFRMDNRRVVEEDWQLIDDDVPAGKIPALYPGYRLDCADNDPSEWEVLPLPEEQALIGAAIAETKFQIGELESKISPQTGNPTGNPTTPLSDDDAKRLQDLSEDLDNLQSNGFLESIPGAGLWGDDATGVYRRLGTANIPFRVRSRSTLQSRPLTLWLWRAQPRPQQKNHFLQVDIGARIRIVFESADRAVLFRKNETRKAADFERADEEWQTLRAKRYLSAEDANKIQDERDAIAKLRADAKGLKRKLTLPEQAQLKASVKAHRQSIRAFQRDHGDSPGDRDRLKELEGWMFRQSETLELSATAMSLIDEPFALTMLDSGMGFVSFQLDIGSNSFTFEDRYTTARHLQSFLWGVDAKGNSGGNDKIELRGSGGALAWRFGYASVNRTDSIRMAPIYLGEAAGDGSNIPIDGRWITPDGTGVDFRLDPSGQKGWYQPGINFQSDGTRVPMVFRAVLQQLATPAPAPSLVWDSADHAGAVVNGTPSLDGERGGALWQLKIHGLSGLDALGLPDKMRRRIAALWVRSHDEQGNYSTWNRVLTGGVVVDDAFENVKGLETPGTAGVTTHPFGALRLTVRDKSQLLSDDRFDEDLELDGLYLGEAIYRIRRNQGASEDELSLLPRGAVSGWKLSSAPPGERAAFKPRKGTSRRDYVENDLVGKFGLGRRYYFDENGRDRLELPEAGADPSLIYKSASELAVSDPAASGRRLYFEGDEGIERGQTTDRFKTLLEVQGAIDPDTKKRRKWRYELAEAVNNPASPLFVGRHIPLDPVVDDAYTTNSDLEAVGRSLIARFCRIPQTWRVRVPYENDVLPGRVFLFAGQGGVTGAWRITKVTPLGEVANDELSIELEAL